MSLQGIGQEKHRPLVSGTGVNGQLAGRKSKEKDLNSATTMNHFLRGVERRAFLTARMATRDEDEALDIVQDSMLKLVQKYAKRPESEWGALFNSILHSRINDWYRRSSVRNRWRVFWGIEEEVNEQTPEDKVPQTLFPDPERQISSDLLGDRLSSLIEQLPLRQQQAIVLRAWEGYSIAQTAEIMNCSEGSVKTHYSRAVHTLRENLGDYHE